MPLPAPAALLTQYYQAFNAGAWDRMCALLAPQVAHDLNQGGREIGRDTFRAFLARMERSYQEQLEDIVLCVGADGTRAAAEYVVVGTYRATDEGLPPARGQRYRLPGGAFFAFEGGLITRVTNYYNLQDWLAQVRG